MIRLAQPASGCAADGRHTRICRRLGESCVAAASGPYGPVMVTLEISGSHLVQVYFIQKTVAVLEDVLENRDRLLNEVDLNQGKWSASWAR